MHLIYKEIFFHANLIYAKIYAQNLYNIYGHTCIIAKKSEHIPFSTIPKIAHVKSVPFDVFSTTSCTGIVIIYVMFDAIAILFALKWQVAIFDVCRLRSPSVCRSQKELMFTVTRNLIIIIIIIFWLKHQYLKHKYQSMVQQIIANMLSETVYTGITNLYIITKNQQNTKQYIINVNSVF